ncbi:hypothetical protein NH340_JMT04859 [Sarcoptes scabiei]|nr:hypothetical protein NH340_JMT04859 [Sarcoptes scabiei]
MNKKKKKKEEAEKIHQFVKKRCFKRRCGFEQRPKRRESPPLLRIKFSSLLVADFSSLQTTNQTLLVFFFLHISFKIVVEEYFFIGCFSRSHRYLLMPRFTIQ